MLTVASRQYEFPGGSVRFSVVRAGNLVLPERNCGAGFRPLNHPAKRLNMDLIERLWEIFMLDAPHARRE